MPSTDPMTPPELLSLSGVSEKYNQDGSVEIDHMDPYFYMAESHIADPYISIKPLLPHFKNPHFRRYMTQILNRYFNYPRHPMINYTVESDQECHEYFNVPAVDTRSTAQNYYFDIELPGVTDKADINIRWISSRSFIVEGEIPRPRICIQNVMDDDYSIEERKETRSEPIDLPHGLVSLSGVPTAKPIEPLVCDIATTKRNTTANAKDAHPGVSHLLSCPGSGESNGTYAVIKWKSTDAAERIPTTTSNRAPPMDEIALMRSRTNNSKSSSHHHKPHNDHDVQSPSAHGFSFLPNHNEHRSPLPLVSPNPFDFATPRAVSDDDQYAPQVLAYTQPNPPSYFPNGATPKYKTSLSAVSPSTHQSPSGDHTSDDLLKPVLANGHAPELLLAERMIGTYKRQCTVPEDANVDQKTTEVRLSAGVLTLRIPRRKGVEGLQGEGLKVVVK